MSAKKSPVRCPWSTFDDPLYLAYHDKEWGVPISDDRVLFEFLVLEIFQAGLSWQTILRKRENFRKAFAGFHISKVAAFGPKDVARLMADAGIVRNRMKIEAAINNAKKVLEIRKEFGSFAKYMWSQVGGKPIVHRYRTLRDYVPFTEEALAWSKDLKARGFRFVGPTVVYAHMQAVGMVNDHVVSCFRYKRLPSLRAKRSNPSSRTKLA